MYLRTTLKTLNDAFFMALEAIRDNLLRSILTLLGIVIGVFAIIAVMTAIIVWYFTGDRDLDEESVNKLLQEIYDESHNIKAKIIRLYNKWEVKVKEPGEVQAIGGEIIKLIAAEAKNQEQKIMILKYLKEVVFDKKDGAVFGKTEAQEKSEMTSERQSELLDIVAKGAGVSEEELEDK